MFKPLMEPYYASGSQRAALKTFTSTLIDRYVRQGIRLNVPTTTSPKRVLGIGAPMGVNCNYGDVYRRSR